MWQRDGVDAFDTPVTYRGLFAVPGFRRVAAATVVARTGAAMQALVLVLFVLARFHSPPLAGVVVFLSIVPGLLLSPVAGALLDRHRRMLLIGLDYAIAATVLALIASLDAAGHLPAAALLVVVAVGSLTNPLSNSGTRSLFPVMVPRRLWERANAVDSGGYVVASIAGPGIAGVLLGLVGARGALLATAALYAAALLLLLGIGEPDFERMATASLAGDALAGLRYVLHHRELRGIAVATAVSNIAFGIISVGMPVLVLSSLHGGDAEVGAMYAVTGVAGLLASVLTGRISSEDREVWFIVAGCALGALGMLTMVLASAVGGGLAVVAAAMVFYGVSQGPYDIGMFSLRQRVTAPSWMGRAFAVSMSLNFIGMPIGSAIAGPVVQHSISIAFGIAVLVDVIAGVAAVAMLRPSRRGRARRGDGTAGVQPGTAVTSGR
ncbi:MAG TPA: MFS transporter [Candidatus Dormibacteraeota bacterium]|nr:MFS transporter [Candidatus Dormibacteraeota bacterium]